jgi:hypothetical protein
MRRGWMRERVGYVCVCCVCILCLCVTCVMSVCVLLIHAMSICYVYMLCLYVMSVCYVCMLCLYVMVVHIMPTHVMLAHTHTHTHTHTHPPCLPTQLMPVRVTLQCSPLLASLPLVPARLRSRLFPIPSRFHGRAIIASFSDSASHLVNAREPKLQRRAKRVEDR